tara:strand:+ start:91 stop:270 length:180 start_codon:yes stop_codon:yes gene_type:complete
MSFGDWEISNYVDRFGDETSYSYIKYYTDGTFSNSATNNSDLFVRILIDDSTLKKNILS